MDSHLLITVNLKKERKLVRKERKHDLSALKIVLPENLMTFLFLVSDPQSLHCP